MYNREKCKSCVYHGYFGAKDIGENNVCCDYSILANDRPCLKHGKNGNAIDRRGGDPENCKFYETGEKLKGRPNK